MRAEAARGDDTDRPVARWVQLLFVRVGPDYLATAAPVMGLSGV